MKAHQNHFQHALPDNPPDKKPTLMKRKLFALAFVGWLPESHSSRKAMTMQVTKLILPFFGLWCMVFSPVSAQTTASSNAAFEVIGTLAGKIRRIGATTANASEYDKAEAEARTALSKLISRDPSADVLVERAPHGSTPLMLAAFYGFSGLTEEFLSSDRVRASINETGPNQSTAWMIANYGMRQAMWSCNPTVLNDPFTWVPIYESQPYYLLHTGPNPYTETRRILEKFGAIPDLAGLKSAWLRTCPASTPDLKARINGSTDVLQTLLEDGRQSFGRFEAATRDRRGQNKAAKSEQESDATPVEPTLKKISLKNFELPADVVVKPPPHQLGTAPKSLSGWWVGSSFLGPRILLIFEEFKSEHDVVMVIATEGNTTKPGKSRRVTAAMSSEMVTVLFHNESTALLALQTSGFLEGEIIGPRLKIRMSFSKVQP